MLDAIGFLISLAGHKRLKAEDVNPVNVGWIKNGFTLARNKFLPF